MPPLVLLQAQEGPGVEPPTWRCSMISKLCFQTKTIDSFLFILYVYNYINHINLSNYEKWWPLEWDQLKLDSPYFSSFITRSVPFCFGCHGSQSTASNDILVTMLKYYWKVYRMSFSSNMSWPFHGRNRLKSCEWTDRRDRQTDIWVMLIKAKTTYSLYSSCTLFCQTALE